MATPFDVMQGMQREDDLIRRNRAALVQKPVGPLNPAGAPPAPGIDVDPNQESMFLKMFEKAPGAIKQAAFPGPSPEKPFDPREASVNGQKLSQFSDESIDAFNDRFNAAQGIGPDGKLIPGKGQVRNDVTGQLEDADAAKLRMLMGTMQGGLSGINDSRALNEGIIRSGNDAANIFGAIKAQEGFTGPGGLNESRMKEAQMADVTARRGQDLDLEKAKIMANPQDKRLGVVGTFYESALKEGLPDDIALERANQRADAIMGAVQQPGKGPPGPTPQDPEQAFWDSIASGYKGNPLDAIEAIIAQKQPGYLQQNIDKFLRLYPGAATDQRLIDEVTPNWITRVGDEWSGTQSRPFLEDFEMGLPMKSRVPTHEKNQFIRAIRGRGP